MSKFILALLLLVSSSAFADEWSTGDTYREATFQTLWAIDALQTHTIAGLDRVILAMSSCLGRSNT